MASGRASRGGAGGPWRGAAGQSSTEQGGRHGARWRWTRPEEARRRRTLRELPATGRGVGEADEVPDGSLGVDPGGGCATSLKMTTGGSSSGCGRGGRGYRRDAGGVGSGTWRGVADDGDPPDLELDEGSDLQGSTRSASERRNMEGKKGNG